MYLVSNWKPRTRGKCSLCLEIQVLKLQMVLFSPLAADKLGLVDSVVLASFSNSDWSLRHAGSGNCAATTFKK